MHANSESWVFVEFMLQNGADPTVRSYSMRRAHGWIEIIDIPVDLNGLYSNKLLAANISPRNFNTHGIPIPLIQSANIAVFDKLLNLVFIEDLLDIVELLLDQGADIK